MAGSTLSPIEVRDIFEHALQTKNDLKHLRKRLEAMQDPSLSGGIPTAIHGGLSDPTANSGTALADYSDEYRQTEARYISELSKVKELCSGIRIGLGLVYGDILEDYYVRGLGWKQVAKANFVSVNTAQRKRDVAFDWVSDVGLEKAIDGYGKATEDARFELWRR